MGWLGKAIGGVVGFAIGGPVGAAIGIGIGHQADKEGASCEGQNTTNLASGTSHSSSRCDELEDDYEYDYKDNNPPYGRDGYNDRGIPIGGAASWDSCEADPDMCCGYDH